MGRDTTGGATSDDKTAQYSNMREMHICDSSVTGNTQVSGQFTVDANSTIAPQLEGMRYQPARIISEWAFHFINSHSKVYLRDYFHLTMLHIRK